MLGKKKVFLKNLHEKYTVQYFILNLLLSIISSNEFADDIINQIKSYLAEKEIMRVRTINSMGNLLTQLNF